MATPHRPWNELERLQALLSYRILDTEPESAFQDLVQLAAWICETPMAAISFVDSDRQWFKARVGIDPEETTRDIAFCSHTILEPDQPLVVEDATRDERFAQNPLVVNDPNIRFYVGAPLVTKDGLALGSVCGIDDRPRTLSPEQLDHLRTISRQIVAQLELRTQAQLVERTCRDLEEFAHIVSHDLKEPLRGMRHCCEFLFEDYAGKLDGQASEYIGSVRDLSLRFEQMVTDLHSYSKTRFEIAKSEPVDVGEVVSDVLESFEGEIQERGVSIRLAENFPTLDVDRGSLADVYRGLVENALKFNDSPEPWIELGAEPDISPAEQDPSLPSEEDKRPTILFVRDNGIGIEPRNHQKIFSLFKRLHGRSEFGGGTGSGLAIARRLCERDGGCIGVLSEVGEGSTFRFAFRATRWGNQECSIADQQLAKA